MQFFFAEQKVKYVTSYFMGLMQIVAELALLLSFNLDVKVQQAQRENIIKQSLG